METIKTLSRPAWEFQSLITASARVWSGQINLQTRESRATGIYSIKTEHTLIWVMVHIQYVWTYICTWQKHMASSEHIINSEFWRLSLNCTSWYLRNLIVGRVQKQYRTLHCPGKGALPIFAPLSTWAPSSPTFSVTLLSLTIHSKCKLN